MPLVFLYGTLMRTGANHAVLARLAGSFIGGAVTLEPRVLVDLGPYPALLPGLPAPPGTRIHGELWDIDDSALRDLDAFEGCPELYVRERIRVVSAAPDEEREAFTYVFARRPPAKARVLVSGRYEASGTALPSGAGPHQIEDATVRLDIQAPTEDVSRPRRGKNRRGPR